MVSKNTDAKGQNMETVTIHTVRFLGTTDDVTTCECCGKKDLKGTVALSINDSDAVFFGCTCAARALGRTVKEIRTESRAADDLARELRNLRRDRKVARDMEIRQLFLDRTVGRMVDWAGRPDYARQLQAAGGYAANEAKLVAFLAQHGAEGVA